MSASSSDEPSPKSGDPGMRTLRRLALGGVGAAFLLAVLVGLIGGTGNDGFAVFLLICALTASLVGLVGVVMMARDDHRDLPVSRARMVTTVVGFLGATLLMAMLAGVGG